MVFSFLATVLFAVSVIAASRSTRLMGPSVANFWRIVVATALLGGWAHTMGAGCGGGAFGWFFLSGCVGFGLGDIALFATIWRLGPRLSSLLINCLAAPFAALIEWGWLSTRLTWGQMTCATLILAGVSLALLPESRRSMPLRTRLTGILFGTAAGFGQGFGAVLSRKAFAVVEAAGGSVDGVTAAYQRILGGLLIVSLPYIWLLLAGQAAEKPPGSRPLSSREKSSAWGWVLLNGLAGPTVGVACYQWALRNTPSGVVLPIVATSPLMVMPFTYFMEGDRPGARSLVGGVLAVAGAVILALGM